MTMMSDYMENKIADAIRAQGLTLPTNWFMALGSAASDNSFTELTGTGYARVSYARSLANWSGTQGAGTTLASTGTSHTSSNNNAISWGNPGSAWGTANYVGFFDALSSGNCWMYVPISAIVITTGSPNPVQIAAGGLAMYLGSAYTSDYFANKLIDLIFRAQAYTFPATLYPALCTVAPTSGTAGTEVSGGSYARASIVAGLTTLSGTQSAGSTVASSGTGGRISNNATVSFPAPTADWGTVLAVKIMDAASSGNMLWFRAITSKTILNGSAAQQFAADALGITLK
jgi:hypothetical protein